MNEDEEEGLKPVKKLKKSKKSKKSKRHKTKKEGSSAACSPNQNETEIDSFGGPGGFPTGASLSKFTLNVNEMAMITKLDPREESSKEEKIQRRKNYDPPNRIEFQDGHYSDELSKPIFNSRAFKKLRKRLSVMAVCCNLWPIEIQFLPLFSRF